MNFYKSSRFLIGYMGHVLFIYNIMDKYDIRIYIPLLNIEPIKTITNEPIAASFEESAASNIKQVYT